MFSKKWFSRSSCAAVGMGVVLATASAVSTQSLAAGAVVTNVPFSGAIFVPCAASGAGELVALDFTLHLVENQDDGAPAEIGIWSGAEGVGLVTGDVYRGSVTSTAIPGGDEYLTNINLSGLGKDAVKFSLTRTGPLFAPPTEVFQVHCQ